MNDDILKKIDVIEEAIENEISNPYEFNRNFIEEDLNIDDVWSDYEDFPPYNDEPDGMELD